MPFVFVLPGPLSPLAGGRSRVEIEEVPADVGRALAALFCLHPALKARVVTEQGEVRPHVNVFVGSDSIRDKGGLATPVPEGAEIMILPAVSGGRPPHCIIRR